MKTQHQNPEFGHKLGEIKKKLQKSRLTFNGVETHGFCGELSSSYLRALFPFS
jgi:hypothetical protein